MLKRLLFASLYWLSPLSSAHAAASLTDQETRWLRAAAPVLAYAQRLKLPIDIIVQPTSGPADVPFAMGFDGQRCKLVLSMRGNPDAEALLEKVPEAERGLLIEAMTAHEIGHCWRYAHGVWHALPAGFVDPGADPADGNPALAAVKAMRDSRREEGFADLVALAWTARHHRQRYEQVYAWLAALRAEQPVARNAHDTRAWVRLAPDAAAFGQAATPFDDVAALWRQGVLADD